MLILKIKCYLDKLFFSNKKDVDPNSFEKIYPKCLGEDFNHFIGSDGYYYPCCFTRVGPSRGDLLNLLGENFEEFNINKHDLHEIYRSRSWKILIDSFENKPMDVCLLLCPKKMKPREQFDGRNGYRHFSTRG